MNKVRLVFFYTLTILISCWVAGFALFVAYACSFPVPKDESIKAAAVLTGGAARIKTGLELLEKNPNALLLISGVSAHADQVLKDTNPALLQQVSLGHGATNTFENAIEVMEFIQENQIKELVVITSFYHMPRSLLEIRNRAPDVRIVPYAVFPEAGDAFSIRTLDLLVSEYHKFLARSPL
jgi:uncharacterized SAM-binding protein YcdF (DUF218 family)